MVDRVKDYVIRTRMETKQAEKDWEAFLKKRNTLTRRYNQTNQAMMGATVQGRRNTGRTGSSGSIGQASRDSLSTRMGDTLSRLRGIRGGASDTAAIDRQIQRVAMLRNELSRVKNVKALTKLRLEYNRANKEAEQLIRTQRKMNNQMNMLNELGNKFGTTMKRATVQLASFYAILEGGKAIFRVGTELDSLRAALLGASEGFEDANRNFLFLKETGQVYGKDVTALVRGFNKIGAGARAMNMEMEEAKNIFLAASEASTAYGLDTARTELVMLAFGQMMSKNRISSEELNFQAPSTVMYC